MFSEIVKFEISYHRRQNLVYVMSGVSFLLFFLAMASPNVQIGGGGANVNLNAAMSIVNMLGAVSVITILVSIAFTANSVVRDYDFKMIEFFLSRPLNRASFIYGRFVGSFFFGVIIFMAGALGILAGEMMPWLDPERLGAVNPSAYVFGTLVYGIPNLFIFSSIFFCVAGITRSMGLTYAIAIGFLLLSALLDTFTERATVQLTSMLDPFGGTAIEEVTRYWTPFEQNTNLPALEGALLANRALWIGISCLFLFASYWLFPTSINRSKKAAAKSSSHLNRDVNQDATTGGASGFNASAVHINQRFDFGAEFAQFWSQTKLEVRGIVFTAPFLIIMLLGMVQVVGGSLGNLGNIVGTSVYPTTSNLIAVINGAFSLPLLVVLVYMSAEMMGREAATRSNALVDAMPHPNWIMIAAKWCGLAVVIVMMLLAVMLAAIGVQLYKGYYEINLFQYLVGLLFFFQFPLYLAITMSLFFYVMTRHKYIAMFLMVTYFVLAITMPALGLQHFLYRMAQVGMPYSDFTGYSQNLVPHLWQTFYWSMFGCLMLLLVHLFWPRGIEDNWANRLKVAKGRVSKRVTVLFWLASTLFVAAGGFIFYNTNVLNEYRTSDDFEALQADYEQTYKQYESLDQLTITSVYADVDIFPTRREVEISGYYEMENQTQQPIEALHLTDPLEVTVNNIDLPGAQLTFDEALHYRIYQFDQPVLPGETVRLGFDIAWLTPGFANSGHSPKLTRNGTFFNNTDAFPLIGYQAAAELQDNNDRRQYDLAPIERMPDLDDQEEINSVSAFGGGRVSFEVVVSTEVGQRAIAPGYLQKDWQENNRHYFHYKMDSPIWNFFSFMSADYEVARDQWQDVALEVYYLHGENVETMIQSSKDSLEYFTKNFSPYQYRQFRIMEFPQFQGRFAQSFPNTIPFSEAIGFTADLRDETELDYVYYVTAHELAHQWWAHQVLGANVQGSTMIVETLAQYSALMVMEQKFGQAHMQRFLSFELDSYLRGRGSEVIEELPLHRVENQPYIHYRKGSVVFYALKDLIGEDAINDALAVFIDQYAFKGAPYPTTRNLLDLIRERADEQYHSAIADMFERIVLFDLKVDTAEVKTLSNGQFQVNFDVKARKFEANGEGVETPVELDDWIDVGVLGEESESTEVREIIQIEKIRLNSATNRYTMVVDQKPYYVGIDPLNKLIDRNPEDNTKAL